MSIINDALKRVQESLSPKVEEIKTPPVVNPNASANLYEDPPAFKDLPPEGQKTAEDQKPLVQNKIKSLLALACATVIIVVSLFYMWQQVRNDIPKVQRLAKKSFYKLIHKEEPVAKAAPALGPLAQLTINPSDSKNLDPTKPAPAPLEIHGIMSNSKGNLVLINDQVYQEGDTVDGAKIIKINLDSIQIDNNGVVKTIFVKS